MASYKPFSLKDKLRIYIKVLKPNEIILRKKNKTFFYLRQYFAFEKFPSLCNYIFIFKLIYSLPGCLLHYLVQEMPRPISAETIRIYSTGKIQQQTLCWKILIPLIFLSVSICFSLLFTQGSYSLSRKPSRYR